MCCELEGPIKPDPDLVEAICLGHDIGHPPFGHIGERTLNNLLRDIGGYDANLQNIRILCVLEEKHPRGGLNLTRATLDGLLKFWTGQTASYDSERPIVQWVKGGHERTSLEAQICDWADTAAYSVADIEDSMRKARLSRRDVLLKRDDVYKEAIGLGVPQDICTHCIEEAIRALPDKFDSKSRQFYVELKEWTSNVLHIELLNPCTILERCRDESCLRYRYALQIPERSKYFALCLRAISKTLVFRSREVEDEDEIHRNCIKELFEHYDHILSGIIVDRNKRLRIVADTISSFTDVGALKKCKEISGRDM
jgi:dGTPase